MPVCPACDRNSNERLRHPWARTKEFLRVYRALPATATADGRAEDCGERGQPWFWIPRRRVVTIDESKAPRDLLYLYGSKFPDAGRGH